MIRIVPTVVLAFALAVAASAAAWAGWFTDEAPPPNAKPLSEVVRSLEDQGVRTITEISFDDGKWSIEARNADGKKIDLKVDAMTGQTTSR